MTFKDADGRLANQLLNREDETWLTVSADSLPWSFDADTTLLRLAPEASRINGKSSIPYKTDKTARYGRHLAARRVARTIMLGSAPTAREQAARGIESSRIRLRVIQPDENIALFNDALNTLRNSLSYLYSNPSNDRFWYDNRPTLRKIADDRATNVAESDVEYEIETRLRNLRKEGPFTGVHICPGSSLDVPDEQSARLVILSPADEYRAANMENQAMTAVTGILNNRGNSPRNFRNTLSFIAPDQDLMSSLNQAVRLYLAWKTIEADSEDLNLDAAQNRETKQNLSRSDDTMDARIKEAYCWLLVPHIDRSVDLKTINWTPIRISGGHESIIAKAAQKMRQNEAIIERWAPALLRMELDNLLWRETDHISIKQLWEYLCTYCYLPRLANFNVLLDTVQAGSNSSEYFALAAGFDGSRYLGLRLNQQGGFVEHSDLLVKLNIAQKQFDADEAKRQAEEAKRTDSNGIPLPLNPDGVVVSPTGTQDDGRTTTDTVRDGGQPPATPKNKRFFMSADLDVTRINRDVQTYVEEIIQHLTSDSNARVNIALEVEAKSDAGFSPQTIRTVMENCCTMKVSNAGFED